MTTKKFPSSAIQPAAMLFASSLNFFGSLAAIATVPSSRTNPFFYTAMATSFIYMIANGIKVAQEVKNPKETATVELENVVVMSAVEKEMTRRENQSKEALTRFYR